MTWEYNMHVGMMPNNPFYDNLMKQHTRTCCNSQLHIRHLFVATNGNAKGDGLVVGCEECGSGARVVNFHDAAIVGMRAPVCDPLMTPHVISKVKRRNDPLLNGTRNFTPGQHKPAPPKYCS